MRIALLPVCLLLLPCLAPAQNPRPRQPAQPVPEIVRPEVPRRDIKVDGNGFTLPDGEITVSELIDATARFLGRNILWNSQELQAVGGDSSFYLQKQVVVDALGCEELLYSMLYTKGLAVLPVDERRGFFEVIALNGPRGREVYSRAASRTAEQVLRRPGFREFCTVTVPLQHINSQVACNSLRQFFQGMGGSNQGMLVIGTAGGNRSLLLMGFGDQIAGALRLLQECDTPQQADPAAQPLQEQLQGLTAAMAKLQERVQELERKAARN